jgi:hypothetical protein
MHATTNEAVEHGQHHLISCMPHMQHQAAVYRCFAVQLLWELDNGRSVGLTGVRDDLLRSQLQYLLELLGLKCTKVGRATLTKLKPHAVQMSSERVY